MGRNDDGFNLEDMMEIFGDAVSAPAKAPAVATQTPPPASAPLPSPSVETEADGLSEEERAILEAYEKQKKEKLRKEEEARRRKEEEAQRILEEYERAQKAAAEREARERAEAEAKRRRELEELKRKEEFKLDAARMAEEERRIIEEFERETQAQKQRQEEERRAKEAELQAQAEALSKKDSRLLELLAKAQRDLKESALPPLPGTGPISATSSPAPGSKATDILLDIGQKECEAFCEMLDETRKAMFTFLAPLIGIKASTNMLNKSVEKARAKAPVILKDANWRMDGSLREDGSVDPERVLKNTAAIPAGTRVSEFLGGLSELLQIRFKAVELGLGATTAGEMRNRVLACRENLKRRGFKDDWIDLFFTEVVR
jgi:hypothetical protein